MVRPATGGVMFNVTIEFQVDLDQYEGLENEQDARRLVEAMLDGNADLPEDDIEIHINSPHWGK